MSKSVNVRDFQNQSSITESSVVENELALKSLNRHANVLQQSGINTGTAITNANQNKIDAKGQRVSFINKAMPNARSIQTERKFEERNNLTDLRGAGKIS
jgi:hypothetical protein